MGNLKMRDVALGVAAATLAASGLARADEAGAGADLRALAERRVFFGHQSVGVNVMDGLLDLSRQTGVTVRVKEVRAAGDLSAPAFGHGFVAANEHPYQKLESFAAAFDAGYASGAEIALLKFCYVDFKADTDAAKLFAAYQATLARLRAKFPQTTFVHVTAPLTTVPTGVKDRLKALLGRPPPPQVLENATREAYNALLRRAYQGREPVFDLAKVESTRPDGGQESAEWQGRAVPVLVPDYTDDGGHLNDRGRQRAARELAAVLAAVSRRPGPAVKAP